MRAKTRGNAPKTHPVWLPFDYPILSPLAVAGLDQLDQHDQVDHLEASRSRIGSTVPRQRVFSRDRRDDARTQKTPLARWRTQEGLWFPQAA
jgi:hypothetical protein